MKVRAFAAAALIAALAPVLAQGLAAKRDPSPVRIGWIGGAPPHAAPARLR